MKKIIILSGFLGIFMVSETAVFAGYFNTTPVQGCDTQITRTLQVGSQNDDVYVLQNMLSQGGYLHATPNGYFGYGTKSAVKAFQRDNSLTVNGVVNEATRNAVNERLCDTDVRGDSYETYYGYTTGVTYVDKYDPYVKVISPQVTAPAIYATPQENNNSFSTTLSIPSTNLGYSSSNGYQTTAYNAIIPATSQSQIQSTGIVYNPSTGYTYGIVPQTGSLTITSPTTNSSYNEGDTVYLAWTTNNLQASQFQILIENGSTGQSKQVTVVSASNSHTSFILTKEILDAVCAGACNNNQQGSFRIVIATPYTDIAGNTSTFRAAVSPITIKRPYSNYGTVSITTSKTPVNSGETFKLYVNIPTGSSWNSNLYGNYSIKIHAVCPFGVDAKIAGVPCGQDFTIPLAPTSFQQEIPAMITNATWYRQDVTFEIVVANLRGEVIGTSKTTVVANAAPFSW